MHIQQIFIIVAFNETLIQKAVDFLIFVPVIGKKLQEPFKSFMANQKQKLHNRKNVKSSEAAAGNMISKIFEIFVIGMVVYFIASIINSLAQKHLKRLHQLNKKDSAGHVNHDQKQQQQQLHNNSKSKVN